jgi:hypothetical protein
LTADDFNAKLDKPWDRFLQKDLKTQESLFEVLSPVLNKLALNVLVRESRWTWVKEQRERLSASTTYFQVHTPETVGEFLDAYNGLIEELVLASSLGLSPHIPQAPTPLEKHYVQEMADSVHEGVEELNNLEGKNDNFINKALGLIHRL